MYQCPDGPGTLGVEIRTYRVGAVNDLPSRAIRNSVVDIACFSTRAHPDKETFGSVAGTPRRDLGGQLVNRPLRSRGSFGHNLELLPDLNFQVSNPSRLQLFDVVWQLHAGGKSKWFD